ncbi:MAG: hypothetical protein WC658_03535 [Candidatus Omnitrophota bacterium]
MKKKPLPFGIELLHYVYRINVILFIVSLFLFHNRILVLGSSVFNWLSYVIKITFILIPLYLSFRLKRLNRFAWVLAISFHSFFIVNYRLNLLESRGWGYALVRIAGVSGSIEYSPLEVFVIVLSGAFNICILAYLLVRMNYFCLSTQT